MQDRGRLAAGLRADLLLVEVGAGRPPRAVASIVAGNSVHVGKGAPLSLG